ncbi:MAG: NADH-ubiquinone oxidoreductase-F iron-sulfur binding region domain-containing protein [Candidatus Kapabacteria bacterium]|nr:NADH-ubiquinone oxidoreductase-F iron-sulfur binding region domain-containing protein [Candidatus Kapabacteria bacterium]
MVERLKRVDVILGNYHPEKYKILASVMDRQGADIIKDLINSGLKGRGGAGFLTGMKWKFAAQAQGDDKYVICNADEGEPGTFKDREILSKVPRKVLSGMGICAKVIGATKGYIYLRGEYKFLVPALNVEIEEFHSYCDKLGLDFRVEIFIGSGAYVCGEETALLNSMEGKRGEPRNKPPFPTSNGLFGKPTVVNNVETLVSAMMVCKIGPEQFKKLGIQDSHGSKLFSVSGDTPRPGIYDLEFGLSLDEFVREFGDGDTKAVQVGGASGFCVPRKKFSKTTIGFKAGLDGDNLPTGGSMMIFNSSRSMYHVLENYLEFFEEESCGQCTPCRVGCQQLQKGIDSVKRGLRPPEYLEQLLKLTETMKITAKCGLGQSVANSFSSIVENFREEMIY